MLSTESHLSEAIKVLDSYQKERDEAYNRYVAEFDAHIEEIGNAINEYVIEHYEASDGYEDDTIKLTKVVSMRRSWNVNKLEKILPRGIFKRVIKIEVDKTALDQLVRDGKIDADAIAPAFEETPSQPYVKATKKKDDGRGIREAATLAEKLA